MKKDKKIKRMVILILVLLLIDQISKIMVKANYENPIENGIFGIRIIENTGMAFGWNSGNTKNMILTILILLLVFNFIRNQKDRIDTKTSIALSLVLAGGISNLVDRILRGGVIDFIQIKHFAIFNIADCYIVIGWILLIVFLIRFNQEWVGGKNCEK